MTEHERRSGEERRKEALAHEILERLVEERTEQLRASEKKLLERVQESDMARQAMLYMLEDMNESATTLIESREELKRSHAELKSALEGTIAVISMAVEVRDPYTAGHQRRVAGLACAIAREMGLDEEQIESIHMGATIHDIGKIYLPAEILTKPTMLSTMERQLVETHPQVGYDILKGVTLPWQTAEIAHQHHERMDGSGYPQGLKGEEICMEARVVAVADVVEAMTTHRPYREGLGIDLALKQIEENRGSLFDPVVADACLKLFRSKEYSLEP